jgi:2-iminobutanoate/2-iminopropanoate deaminase
MSIIRAPVNPTKADLAHARRAVMQNLKIATLFVSSLVLAATASAQTFEKKHYNYSEWTKGRFSEAVTVTGPGKMIFLAGVGSEDEGATPGVIRHKDDFVGQCKYAYDKIKRALEKNGATLADAVKIVTYLTDIRYQPTYATCRREVFGSIPMPAHTLLNINQLAWPGMMVEIDVTAMVPLK